MGKPRTHPNGTQVIAVRVPTEHARLAQVAAARRGMVTNGWVKELVAAGLRAERLLAPEEGPEDPEA